MRKTILTLSLALVISACAVPPPKPDRTSKAPDYATAEPDLSSPQGTAYAMMMGMYRGDTALIDRVFHARGTLQRVKPDGTVEFGGRKGWQDWVSTLKTGQANEELFAIRTKQFGKLATVWAPFVISFDGKIVGCGVNQLSMAKSNGEWKIVSGMDVQAPKEDCADFKADYKNQ